MGGFDRESGRDKPAETAIVGQGAVRGGELCMVVETRTRGEAHADLRQAAESGWDRSPKFDAPRGELARFKPERAGLPEVSIGEAARYIERYRGDRPWLQALDSASPEARRVIVAADLAGAHGHIRHDGWVTEEAGMRRAAYLEDPAQLDPARRLRGIDGLIRGGKHHACDVLATRVTDPDAYATAFVRGTEHPGVRAALDGPHDLKRHPWPVDVPIADLLGGDGHRFCTGWALVPETGSTEGAWHSRQEWRAAMHKGREPGVPRPAVRPVPTFEGGTMAFIVGSNRNHDGHRITTMCPDPQAEFLLPRSQRGSQRETP